MPKRSRSRTRKRTRQSGGYDHNEGEKKEDESMGEDDEGKVVPLASSGGKRGKTSRKGKKRMKKSRKGKKMNEFFKLLIKAKKSGAPSFVYKGKTYKRKVGTKKNPKLVIYKKA